jgi:galactokinase
VRDIELQIAELKARLIARVGCLESDIRVAYSPLRVSPLGAHVDHQDGLVTGMTLDQAILLAFAPRHDARVCVQSANFPGNVAFDLHHVPPKVNGDWGNYVRGAVLALQQHYPLHLGIDALVEGHMPIGGLSSSAAVGVAYLLALEAANDLDVSPQQNIELDRFIENQYLGLQNGVLDQSIILLSDRDHLTFLDCQTRHVDKVPTAADNGHFEVLVAYSGLQRSLVSTDYNSRVRECQQAARTMLEWVGEPVPAEPRLRMVREEVWAELGSRLPAPLDRRARHFFTECQRVRAGVKAWSAGDLEAMGRLINQSGESSVHDYESGCPHLVTLYDILRECHGVYGARFSGAGFRGSCIGLVNPRYREEIEETITTCYPAAHPDMAERYSVHFCRLDGPARLWNGLA